MPVQTFTAASTAFVAKVNKNRAICIGGGGSSGAATGSPSNTGGGAGGQCSIMHHTWNPGSSHTIAAAQAVAGTTATNNLAGGDSTVDATVQIAKGGAGSPLVSANSTRGAAASGSITGGVGDTVTAGGNGAQGGVSGASPGGGGGGGAGLTGAGGNASGGTGGTGTAPSLAGGNGGSSSAGIASSFGGGGGGAHANSATDRAGSGTSIGAVFIDWIPPNTGILLGVGT